MMDQLLPIILPLLLLIWLSAREPRIIATTPTMIPVHGMVMRCGVTKGVSVQTIERAIKDVIARRKQITAMRLVRGLGGAAGGARYAVSHLGQTVEPSGISALHLGHFIFELLIQGFLTRLDYRFRVKNKSSDNGAKRGEVRSETRP